VNHADTTRQTYERINAGDIEGFGDLLSDDFTEKEGGLGFPATKAGTLDFFRYLRNAFPDMHMTVDDLIDGSDKTVARVHVTGTHKGEFAGLAPTGHEVDMELVDIMGFDDDGLICAHWGVADMLTLMQQLGAVPAPA
jgi:steroid delta-isomerase-like uncharacterized protein